MGDATWALQQARQVGPIAPPKAEAQPIKKLHTGPLHSNVAGRTDHLPSNVPNGAYVLPADIISGMGEGNTMAGFKAAKKMFEGASRQFGGSPYSGNNGPYGQSAGPYGMGKASGGGVGNPVPHGWERLHRGESSGNKGGNFWTHDREFARNFTQSGQDHEIKKRYIHSNDVHVPSPLPYAGDEGAVTSAVNTAKGLGKSAVRLSEGDNQPNSTFVFNKPALKFAPNPAPPAVSTGGYTHNDGDHVPVAVAGGEHVIAPHEVKFAGMGDMSAGHRALDEFVLRQRKLLIKTLKGLRGPKRGDE